MPGFQPPSNPQAQNIANSLVQSPDQPQTFQFGANTIRKGSLIIFPYMFYKHDARPCVIVSSVVPGYMIKGVNLHYLTFPYVRRVLTGNVNNAGFSYYNIKGDQYIVNAFRSYLWRGIRLDGLRVLDGAFLLKMMNMVRSFDPTQVRAIRLEIERQLSQEYQQPAGPTPDVTPQI